MATNISDQEPVLVLNDKKYIISELEPQAQYCVGQMNFIQGNITKKSWDMTKLSSRKCYLAKQSPGSKSNFPEITLTISSFLILYIII